VEPVFAPSVNNFSNLSAVSDMISHIQSAVLQKVGIEVEDNHPRMCSVHLTLLEQDFTQVEMARVLGCSTKTVHRRIVEFGLSSLNQVVYTTTDDDLDALVRDFVSNFPTTGQKTLAGHLCTLGYHIQRYRIRESLYCVDPWGVEQCSQRLLHRQRYKAWQTAYGTLMETTS